MDTPNHPARVVWHTTESGAGDNAFKNVGQYLISEAYEPHILYDPTTDRLGQFGPLNQSARALQNDGSARTNRTGKACIQVEVLGKAEKPFTSYWKPGKNFKALMDAIRSWGVPDVFPMGAPPALAKDCKRDRNVWLTKGGHYGHCNVPGNSHWDPGHISTSALFSAAPGGDSGGSSGGSPSTYTVKSGDTLSAIGQKTGVAWMTIASLNGIKAPYVIKPGQVLKLKGAAPKPSIPAFPGTGYFKAGASNQYVTQLGQQLVKKGYGRFYQVGPGPTWTAVDRAAVKAFQLAHKELAGDADGYPGPLTWKLLFG
ncbi:peptidoglycan-binding protein [Streptomyces sp. PsTaAH-124]|uniref:peptidoglycan-binding protein n=1 Tax=Streptomyces sp. PsTaAH-124 TaxID=1157638 RepID=UPI001F35AAFF|nr:peptidoglycan-binding protein [Streptomyces sp. PsTaAH-124]